MRCYTDTHLPMRRTIPGSGSMMLAWVLLLVAALTTHAHAARSWHQKQHPAAPNIVLPPGTLDGIDGGTLPEDKGERTFKLRHIYHHGATKYPNLHRYIDVPTDAILQVTDDYGATLEPAPELLRAKAQSTTIQRLVKRSHSDINALLAYADQYGHPADLDAKDWIDDHITSPNISDKSTILTFAKMAANAYVMSRKDGEWMPVKGGFNYTDDFGWEADGLRGHIFADEKNATIVIGLKGTSPAVFDGADTTGNDKLNDNLFGSCCCGQGGDLMWKQVCDCMTGTYTCNSTCLVKSLREKGHYYRSVRELYSNVTERYPNSDVWLAGHSLGGVVSALLGLTYGLPTLTFEAFPDAMAAKRLGLPAPPGYKIGAHQARSKTGIHHFGHTADPIFMGECNGGTSFCSIGGYAFQGLCHTGETCIYDTVNDLGWRKAIGTHKIVSVIKDVLEKYDTVPSCEEDIDCEDCLLWKFYESNGTETTTSKTSKTTSTVTRTETCKTPGWWGCLDETTTSAPTTTTSSSSTSTCKTPGWFGCLDPSTTTTSTSTTSSPTATPAPTITTTSAPTSTSKSSSTCKTPGWFGCYDPTTTSTSTTTKPSHTVTSTTAEETDTCTSREWFGLICVDPSPITTSSTSKPSPTKLPTTKRKKCVSRHWYGTCKDWKWEDLDPKMDL